MNETIDRYGNVDWSYGIVNFVPVDRSPAGHSRPLFAQRVSYEYPGYTEILTTEDCCWEMCLRINGQGIGLYGPNDECVGLSGAGDGIYRTPDSGFPALPNEGWKVCYARCDQTGGMCMVDVYVFENGWCLTVNEECAALHKSIVDWDYNGEDFPFIKPEVACLDFC